MRNDRAVSTGSETDLAQPPPSRDRRGFLRASAAGLGVGFVAGSCATTKVASAGAAAASGAPSPAPADEKEAEVTPGEDLMQEHGLLERVLLIYDEAAHRLGTGAALDLGVLADAATLVRRFVHDYHERQEEQLVFPRLQAAKKETELVSVLLLQHERARLLTDEILRRARGKASPDLGAPLLAFVRMYRPHAAREDTVLFPAFRDVVGRGAYVELGEAFEAKEHELFGERGFEKNVALVARLEERLGLGDLARFTAPTAT